MRYDLIIVGAGPAGLAAGIYAGRYRLNAVILEKMSVGGQIILSPTIENYPGFPEGITTIELMERFKKQIDELGVSVAAKEVIGIATDLKSNTLVYTIKTTENVYEAKAVIIASGAKYKKLGVKGEDEFIGRGVSYCGTCDAPFFRNKEILVVGGGDRALEEAIFLSSYAGKVTLVHRRNLLRGSKILEEKARQNNKINFMLESVIEEIVGKEKVEGVKIKSVSTGEVFIYPCQGVFIFVGIEPNTGFLANFLETNDKGFIVTGAEMNSSREGIYACGDCREKSLYQVINACGDAAVAADSAHKYLINLDNK